MKCQELMNMMEIDKNILLIDIREVYEYEDKNIGGINIPMGEILNRLDEIPKDRPVVIHCQSGSRGQKLTHVLFSLGYENVTNLEGGLESYLELSSQVSQ
jgi:sulfur-carrier protein adenylyltransferase/sulfurtransferase